MPGPVTVPREGDTITVTGYAHRAGVAEGLAPGACGCILFEVPWQAVAKVK